MKRQLLQNVKVLPVTSGTTVIDRDGFLSAVLGVTAAAAGDIAVSVTHCDTAAGTFEAVKDDRMFGLNTTVGTGGAVSTSVTAAKDELVNVGIDLIGCKQFVTVTAVGVFAITLGDSDRQPV